MLRGGPSKPPLLPGSTKAELSEPWETPCADRSGRCNRDRSQGSGAAKLKSALSLTTDIDLALCFVVSTAPDIAQVERMPIRLAVLG